ncbi:MAG: MerR family transcriptional regulator [Gammaproteobacteria bacterium]|nr:MerR family transcriptional regulator [Gammaproteobacteria bacterium]
MRVNELAKKLSCTPDTVRYYTRLKLVSPIKNNNGYKHYSVIDQNRLRFILSARQLGFSVSDIEKLLEQADTGKATCQLARSIIEDRLKETEKLFTETLMLRERMLSAIEDWKKKPDQAPTGTMICHLIESATNTSLNE